MTSINGSVALVTGGSRGIGKALVEELYTRGAAKVYATARDPRTVTHPDPVPLALELTGPESALAGQALTRQVKAGLAADPAVHYPQVTAGPVSARRAPPRKAPWPSTPRTSPPR